MTRTALILGASGRFGRNAAKAFEAAGWSVHRFNRKTEDMHSAMARADVTVNAMNPWGYHLWGKELVPLHARVIKAAKGTGTTIILPGNVYVFGPDAGFPWTADSPHLATNPLARLRSKVEQMYRDCDQQVINLRCGDFIDTENTMNWFEGFMTKRISKGRLVYPGDPDVPRAWAYLPDAARAAVMLAERRETLSRYEDIPFEGLTLTGHEMADLIGRALGRPVRLVPFGWWQLRLARPFVPAIGGLFEMRYLWSLPHRLDGGKLAGILPDFRETEPERAMREALAYRTGVPAERGEDRVAGKVEGKAEGKLEGLGAEAPGAV